MTGDQFYGPWPDVAMARLFLRHLCRLTTVDAEILPDAERLSGWIIEAEISTLAAARLKEVFPQLAVMLMGDVYVAIAEHELHLSCLQDIAALFAAYDAPVVLLKGAALGLCVYEESYWRIMADIDLWMPEASLPGAVKLMGVLGYESFVKVDRPFSLQLLADGEVRFSRKDWHWGNVELHLSPFSGWWLHRVACVDVAGVWSRKEPLAEPSVGLRLSPEDMVLQNAVHTAVNHQFGLAMIRSLLDVVFIEQALAVDWNVVVSRAQAWRVATAVYLVLELVDRLIGIDGLAEAMAPIRPSRWRRWLLHRFVTPESVLAGRDLRDGPVRFLLLLLLVDRVRDMGYLIYRTVWPEKEWLVARYGRSVSHLAHIGQIMRRRSV